jgi:putative transposase
MSLFKNKYRTGSIRLKDWDYSSDGWYFVTICTKGMQYRFGEIRNGVMGLNEIGCIVTQLWAEIPNHFTFVTLDEWIVMPNHVHGIIIINHPSVETRHGASLHGRITNKFGPLHPKSLPCVVNHFKGAVKRWCNKNGYEHFQWQSLYFDRIIRDENGLGAIREYIYYNPYKWTLDRNNPESLWA